MYQEIKLNWTDHMIRPQVHILWPTNSSATSPWGQSTYSVVTGSEPWRLDQWLPASLFCPISNSGPIRESQMISIVRCSVFPGGASDKEPTCRKTWVWYLGQKSHGLLLISSLQLPHAEASDQSISEVFLFFTIKLLVHLVLGRTNWRRKGLLEQGDPFKSIIILTI